MRILDTKYRLFGKVNLFDATVALVVLTILVIVGSLVFDRDTAPIVMHDVEYVVKVTAVSGFDDSYVTPGDVVSPAGGGTAIGEVVSVRVEPSQLEYVDAEGVHVYDRPGFQDVYITVKAQGEETGQGVLVGQTLLRDLMVLSIHTPMLELDSARITDLAISEQ